MQKIKSFPNLAKSILVLCWTYLGNFFADLVVSLLFLLIFGKNFSNSTPLQALYLLFNYSLALFLIIFLPPRLIKSQLKKSELGINKYPTYTDIGLAPVAFIAYYILSTLLMKFFTLFSWFDVEESQDVGFSFAYGVGDKILVFLALVLVAPIAEELIFRGFLYGKLRKFIKGKLSLFLSIILTSLLFAFMHGQWNVGVSVFILSVIFCLLREVTGTIYSGIFLHIIKNAVAFFLVFVLGI